MEAEDMRDASPGGVSMRFKVQNVLAWSKPGGLQE